MERPDLDERLAVHAVEPQRGPQPIVEKRAERLLQISDVVIEPSDSPATWRIAPTGGFASSSSEATTLSYVSASRSG